MNKSQIHFSIQQTQCDACDRWYHAQCVNLDTTQMEEFKVRQWHCVLCE